MMVSPEQKRHQPSDCWKNEKEGDTLQKQAKIRA